MKWDRFLKEEDPKSGIDAGTCFSTSNAFCNILNDDFGIPCRIEEVETLIGNKKARDLFVEKINADKSGEFWKEMEAFTKSKPREQLTADDPVLIGMGYGKEVSEFHFIMNLYKNKEVVDLTLKHVQRPHWGISCRNYWTKYWNEGSNIGTPDGRRDFFLSPQIMNASGCVLLTATKTTPAHIHISKEQYQRQYVKLRDYIREQVVKRNIPVFMR